MQKNIVSVKFNGAHSKTINCEHYPLLQVHTLFLLLNVGNSTIHSSSSLKVLMSTLS